MCGQSASFAASRQQGCSKQAQRSHSGFRNEVVAVSYTHLAGCKIASTSLQDYYAYSPAVKEFINSHAENIIRVHDSIDLPADFTQQMLVDRIYEYTADTRSYYVCKNASGAVTQRISLGEKPVSYTHLDVYKRQPMTGGILSNGWKS